MARKRSSAPARGARPGAKRAEPSAGAQGERSESRSEKALGVGPQRPGGRGERALRWFRVGIGFDAHRLVEGRTLILGGERIDHPRGLQGHSDGDALLHALTDALLGSIGAPDIGSLFPPGDPEWKDASSRRFVERAVTLVGERGYRVSSVDVVVIAEAPKLAPHVPSIRARLSTLLRIDPSAVGLKATTTDGMGFTGRGEGIAVQAVVTVASKPRRPAASAKLRRASPEPGGQRREGD